MSKLNNKGYMLVEIILASVLAFGLAFFLLELTIKLKNKNDDLLVKTLVSTDQAIVMNTIMKEIEENYDSFECTDIEFIPVDGGTAFKLDDEVKSIITEFATVEYYANDINYCDKIKDKKTAIININISVKQLPDENFDSKIDYSEVIPAKMVPVLDDGLIPVTISNDGTVTTASRNNENNSWYNYEEKRWANAVLVKQNGVKTRNYYIEKVNNKEKILVHQDDVLAYFVWIPRYSYMIWNNNEVSGPGYEREIQIKFQTAIEKDTGSAIGTYVTHPAFTFGDKELSGFWMGKFETSTDNDRNCYIDGTWCYNNQSGYDNCVTKEEEPRILPNVKQLVCQNISTQFKSALKLAGGILSDDSSVSFTGNTVYGLSNKYDSHIIKNTEWAAVAYLSHSKYGINGEIRVNANQNYVTGCGAESNSDSWDTVCDIKYGSGVSEYPQSTTGNITGVFDMSGGVQETVMANCGGIPNSNSGFVNMPKEKYWNKYSYNSYFKSCNGGYCLGHALNETSGYDGGTGWYDDETVMCTDTSYQWIRRGGNYTYGSDAGIFMLGRDNGHADKYYGFRIVLVN